MKLSKLKRKQNNFNKLSFGRNGKNTLTLVTLGFLLGVCGGILIAPKTKKFSLSGLKNILLEKKSLLKSSVEDEDNSIIIGCEDYLELSEEKRNSKILDSKNKIKEYFDKKKGEIKISKKFNTKSNNDIVYNFPLDIDDENDRIEKALIEEIYDNKSEEIGE